MTRSRTMLGLMCLPGGVVATTALSRTGVRLLESSSSHGGDPAAAVTGLAAAGATLIAGWLTLCLALTLAAEFPGAVGDVARDLRDQVTPAVVQRWAAVALGASVGATFVPGTAVAGVRVSVAPAAAGTTVPAPGWSSTRVTTPSTVPGPGAASTSGFPEESTPVTPAPGWLPADSDPVRPVARSAPDPGWVPNRPPARQRTDPHLLTGRQRSVSEEHTVVVRRGDTLWSIAAAHLGPGATDVEIAREWPHWHEANRTVIGEDPHALLPGTQLTPPPTSDHPAPHQIEGTP